MQASIQGVPFIRNRNRLVKVILGALLLAWIFCSTGVQIYRILRGIDITDESFYVAEVVSVLKGNVPYAFNNFVISGQTFFSLLPTYIFSLLNPSLSGIMLFSRLLFLAFRICVLTVIYFLFQKKHNRFCLLLFLSVIYSTWGGDVIHQLSYDTVPFFLDLLIAAILLAAFENNTPKRLLISSCVSGVLVTFAVLAHEAQAPNAILFGLMILLFCPQKKIRNTAAYYLSGIGATMIVVGVLSACSSWSQLKYGFETLWFYNSKLPRKTPLEIWNRFCQMDKYGFGIEMLALYISMGVTVLCRLARVLLRSNEKADRILLNLIPTLSLILLAYGIWLTYDHCGTLYINEHLGMIVAVVNVILLSDAVLNRKKDTIRIVTLFFIPLLAWFIPTGFFTNQGALHRTSYFWVSAFGMMLVYEPVLVRKKWPFKALVAAVFVALALLSLDGLNRYVYRDEKLNKLQYQIQSGVYKGLYTTEDRGKATEELEEYLKANTSEDDRVLCLDTVPMAYLMVNGTHCTPSTWDRMQHTYDVKNRDTSDEIMYRYFRNKRETPTVIVYVDFGRDDQLSIEEAGYPFNRFVQKYYRFEKEDRLNEFYRVRIYRPADPGFDPDFVFE